MQKTVCLVEDDTNIRELVEILLESSGFRVVSCSTRQSFHVKMESERPNLIILDVMLPDGNGLDICAGLKENETTRSIPVLLMSADHSNRGKEAATRAQAFIAKPFDIDDFQLKVETLVS